MALMNASRGIERRIRASAAFIHRFAARAMHRWRKQARKRRHVSASIVPELAHSIDASSRKRKTSTAHAYIEAALVLASGARDRNHKLPQRLRRPARTSQHRSTDIPQT